MARYNTVTTAATTSGVATFNSPAQGVLTTLTGTAPYTVTLASPVLYFGDSQSFFNNTSGTITLSTPAGNIKGPGFTAATSQAMPAGATYMLTSDGTDYVITNNEGGPQVMTTLATSSTLTANGALNANGILTASNTANFTGASVATSASQVVSGTYDVINKNYLETKYGQLWAVRNSAFTATAGGRYFIDTNPSAFTVTLPASPTLGDEISFIDFAGTFAARNLTVGNNGNRIMRILDAMIVSTNGAAFTLVWSGAANGWLMAAGI